MIQTVKEMLLTCDEETIRLAAKMIHKYDMYSEIKRWLLEDELTIAGVTEDYVVYLCITEYLYEFVGVDDTGDTTTKQDLDSWEALSREQYD